MSLVPISPGRRRKDALMRGVLAGATALALLPLLLIIYFLIRKGLGAWSGSFLAGW